MSTATAVKPSLTIKRRFNVAPEKVYAAWIDPEKMSRWLGPPNVIKVNTTTDVTIGGRYTIQMIVPNDEHNVTGVYREIVPNRKLVFTWGWHSTPERESLVTVTFMPDGDGTLMTLHHEQFFDEAARDRHEQGWTVIIPRLDALFTSDN
ncbi:MAG TPA: SRPBCC domain-containing protein [Pseudolabrys sp.]|jgi:uncharacterized protein YndB with AHSA1/START domain